MGNYSIKDLEQLSNIKAHTLRMWEQRYSFLNPKRTSTKIRYYSDDDLRLVLNVSFLKNNGFKISHIAKMSAEEMGTKVKEISKEDQNFSNQINSMIMSMVDLDEDRFDKIISTNSLQVGLESTMINIVFPFLNRIGVLWQTGGISPAHEHFISSLIRQKLIIAIDGQFSRPEKDAAKYLLFLPEGELHELSLLFANYIIKSRNNKSIYLGQSLPMEDLKVLNAVYKPDVVLTVITNYMDEHALLELFGTINENYEGVEILATGYQVIINQESLSKHVTVIKSFEHLIDYVESKEI